MNKIILAIIVFLLVSVNSYAFEVRLTWYKVSGPVTGYVVYVTTIEGTTEFDIGDESVILLSGLGAQPGIETTYQIAAYNACGVGEKSNPLVYTIPLTVPDKPSKPSVSVQYATLEG